MAKKKKFSNNQNGESVDPELTNKLMQYLFGRNTNNPSILNVRSPNEYGVSFGDRFNIQSGLSFDPMSSMPTGYGKVGINNKGFNLGLEKRKGFNEDATIFDLGYNNPNFNVNARYSNINNIPSIGGNIGYNNKGFNVGVAGNYSPDNKNISANLGYNKGGFNAGLNYDYSGQHSLSGNIGYSNDDYNVNLSGKYTPGDSNISLNTIYNLGKRKKQKAEPIPLAFNEPKEQINLIKENTNLNSIETDEAVGPPKKSNGGKITNMKKKKSNNLPKYFNGTPDLSMMNMGTSLNIPTQSYGNPFGQMFNFNVNQNPTLGNQNPNVSTNKNSDFSFKQMDNQNLKNMNVTGKGMSNMLGNATGPLGGVMKMLNGPLAPLAGMAMNSVTDMVDAIVTPERERRPVLQNAASYTFDNGGTVGDKPRKKKLSNKDRKYRLSNEELTKIQAGMSLDETLLPEVVVKASDTDPRIINSKSKNNSKNAINKVREIEDWSANITGETMLDQIPYLNFLKAAYYTKQGRPLTAVSEIIKMKSIPGGDAIINAVQDNPTDYNLTNIEDKYIPELQLGKRKLSQIGQERLTNSSLPALDNAYKQYGISKKEFVNFINQNTDLGRTYEKALGDLQKKIEYDKIIQNQLNNPIAEQKANGGTIKIKPSKRGTFTAAAKKHGKSVQEFASQVLKNKDNYSPAMVKKANFARNAAKWKKAMGGIVEPEVFANGGLTGTYMDAFDAMAYGGMVDPSMYMQQMMYGSYAQGGQIPQNVPVEVEGEEMYEMPNGQVGEFQGAKHENGGMPMALPEGTKIYSDRLKVNGKTMAARKDKREANIAKLERLLTKNPNDKFLKEALKRQQETNALQEQGDMQQQEMANQQQQMEEMAMEQMLMGAAQQDMQEGMMMAMGGMIKRADGSYSKRGLWDNIRANRGSGKKPTKEMLKQERKIKRAEKAYGGMIKYADGGFVDNCPDGYEKDDNGNCIPIRESKMMGVYGRINEADNNPFFTQREYNETRDRLSKLQPQTTKITDAPLTSSEKFSSIIPTEMFDGRLMQIREDIEYDKNGNPMQVIYDEDIPRTTSNIPNTNTQLPLSINNTYTGMPDVLSMINTPNVFPGNFQNLPSANINQIPTSTNIPNVDIPNFNNAPKKENRFMNFLNNAVDKTGDFFTGLFDKKGKPKTDRGTNTTNNSGDLTEGDRTGMFGTSVGMYGPALMTMLNRMETPPNVNFFNSFGQEALRTQEEAEGLAGISKDEAYRKNLMRANALRKQLVNSARGVNDIRSGQLSAALTEQEGARGILANYLQGMSGLKGQRAALQQQIDQTRMGGEQQRDLADRQDLDQFYTNLAENVANASNMMQKQGRDLNVVQYNKDIMSLSKAYSKYGVYAVRDPRSGLLTLAQKDANGKVVYLTEDEVKELPKKQPEIITTTVEEPKTSN